MFMSLHSLIAPREKGFRGPVDFEMYDMAYSRLMVRYVRGDQKEDQVVLPLFRDFCGNQQIRVMANTMDCIREAHRRIRKCVHPPFEHKHARAEMNSRACMKCVLMF